MDPFRVGSSNQQLIDRLSTVIQRSQQADTSMVYVPTDLLTQAYKKIVELGASGDLEEDDTILDEEVADSEIRSTLRQTFSSFVQPKTSGKRARRSSTQIEVLVRQFLQKREPGEQTNRKFLGLVWYLCRQATTDEPTSVSEQEYQLLLHFFEKCTTWGFDVLSIREFFKINGSELVFVVLVAFYKLDLATFISCSNSEADAWNLYGKLANFVWVIAGKYLDNPYHNVAHAADVTQTCLSLLVSSRLSEVLTPAQQVCLLVAIFTAP